MRPVLVLSAVVCTVCFVACGGKPGNAPTASIQAKKTWTREEFKKMVMGKNPDDVIAAVGKPDSTKESGDDQYWFYKKATVDPLTGKTDDSSTLGFTNGVVVRVSY